MSQITHLFFDFDNTLTDFHEASVAAFSDLLLHLELKETKDDYAHFSRINAGVWRRFERGEIGTDGIRHERFTSFFKAKAWDIGLSGYEANALYLEGILRHTEPYLLADDLLAFAKKHFQLSMCTNGLKEIQRRRVDKLGWTDHFGHIVVSDEINVAKPDEAYFKHVHQLIGEDIPTENILMIGDSLTSDIKGGKSYGLQTCWIRDGRQTSKYADHQVSGLDQLTGLLRSLATD